MSSNYSLNFTNFSYVLHDGDFSLCSNFQIYTAIHACFQPELNTVILPFDEVHFKSMVMVMEDPLKTSVYEIIPVVFLGKNSV